MAKRIMFIGLWTLLFFLLGKFVAGIYLGVSLDSSTKDELIGTTIYFQLVTFPKIIALVGLALGFFGRLPGTQSDNGK